MSFNEVVIAGVLLLRRQRAERRWWVHPINQSRLIFGEYHHLMPDLRNDEDKFYRYLRMEFQPFDELLQRIQIYIQRRHTKFRTCIEPEQRLVVTLR